MPFLFWGYNTNLPRLFLFFEEFHFQGLQSLFNIHQLLQDKYMRLAGINAHRAVLAFNLFKNFLVVLFRDIQIHNQMLNSVKC